MEEKEQSDRTEEATPKRREEARKKGQIATSRSVVPAATLIGAAAVLGFAGEDIMLRLERIFVAFFEMAGNKQEMAGEDFFTLGIQSGFLFLPILAPFLASLVVTGVGSGLMQTRFLWSTEALSFDFSRINPINGFKKLFSPESVAELVKTLLLLFSLGLLGFYFFKSDMGILASLSGLDTEEIVVFTGVEGARLIKGGVMILAAVAAIDYLFHHWRNETKLKMSRQEVKEEVKEYEGDPILKSRMRSLRQRLARQRMMADVAKADVIITNPTELAIALRYAPGESSAPKVLAKGAGFIAQKIRETARGKGIPIVENKPLARLIYKMVNVGQEIPEALYRAVAEVLAYVYRLRKK